MVKNYSAGIYEQGDEGWRAVEWSRHITRDLAMRAARKYARAASARTGGALTWSAWWREGDAPAHEVHQ